MYILYVSIHKRRGSLKKKCIFSTIKKQPVLLTTGLLGVSRKVSVHLLLKSWWEGHPLVWPEHEENRAGWMMTLVISGKDANSEESRHCCFSLTFKSFDVLYHLCAKSIGSNLACLSVALCCRCAPRDLSGTAHSGIWVTWQSLTR